MPEGRAAAEVAALQRLTAGDPATVRAEVVLIAHQRRDVGSCLCGWSELGKSYAGHQVAMLSEAGLLNDAPEGLAHAARDALTQLRRPPPS